jgi:hypothetical protein
LNLIGCPSLSSEGQLNLKNEIGVQKSWLVVKMISHMSDVNVSTGGSVISFKRFYNQPIHLISCNNPQIPRIMCLYKLSRLWQTIQCDSLQSTDIRSIWLFHSMMSFSLKKRSFFSLLRIWLKGGRDVGMYLRHASRDSYPCRTVKFNIQDI